jgi:hypothetical protein
MTLSVKNNLSYEIDDNTYIDDSSVSIIENKNDIKRKYPKFENNGKLTNLGTENDALNDQGLNSRADLSLITPIPEEILQSWEGVVLSIDNDEILVRIKDLTNKSNPEEELLIFRDELNEADSDLIEIGAMFYWQIGCQTSPNQPKFNFSVIKFRRLPKWSQSELDKAERLAEEYADYFGTN